MLKLAQAVGLVLQRLRLDLQQYAGAEAEAGHDCGQPIDGYKLVRMVRELRATVESLGCRQKLPGNSLQRTLPRVRVILRLKAYVRWVYSTTLYAL